MPSVVVADFKYGLDHRRPRAAAPPGTLWTLTNAVISRGGDLERSKKWVPTYTLPAGTFGLSNINGQLTVFGSANLAGSMPVGVQYQRLDPGTTMTRLLKVTVFAAQYYVIAEYNDGNIHHWYNGVNMTAWDALSDANSSQTTLAAYLASKVDGDAAVHATASGSDILITADVPGVPFTATSFVAGPATITLTTLQANVPAVTEVRSSGTLTITSGVTGTLTDLTISGVHLITAPVPYLIDNPTTANAVAVEITNNTSASGYQASVTGNVVTVFAATGTGASPNGLAIVPTVNGAFGTTNTAFAGGVTAVAPVAQVVRATLGGTYVTNSTYTITIAASVTTSYFATGRASGYGTSAFTYKQRIYFPAGNLLRYCALSDPTVMTGGLPASGPGFISVANDSEGSDPMLCLAPYQIYVALFSRRSIRIYDLQSDATQTNFRNPLQNTGTLAPNSVLSYGNTDVFYFDDTGVRSVQSRDVINTPFVGDVGSPIDLLIHDWYSSVGEVVASRSCSAIEPLDGRFMMAIGPDIFTLSYFPNSKVTAWSIQQPGFTATDFTASKRQLYARSTIGGGANDTIYLYGGLNGTTYANAGELTSLIETSFVSAQSPDKVKAWIDFSMACQNVWDIYLLVDPDDDTRTIHIGKISKNSYDLTIIPAIGEFPYVAVRAICTAAGQASISNMTLGYTVDEE